MEPHVLTDIPGIGAAAAAQLQDAGFKTPTDIAAATPERLGVVKGFGPARSAKIIAAAEKLLGEPEREEKPQLEIKDDVVIPATAAIAAQASVSKGVTGRTLMIAGLAVLVVLGVAATQRDQIVEFTDSLVGSSDDITVASVVSPVSESPAAVEETPAAMATRASAFAPALGQMAAVTDPAQIAQPVRVWHPYAYRPAYGYMNNTVNSATRGGFSMSFSGRGNNSNRGYGYRW